MPLTLGQKARLLASCVPFLTLSLMVIAYFVLVSRQVIPPPVPLLFAVVFAALLFTGYEGLKALRDLISGVALVREDLFQGSYRAKGAGRRFFGRFEQLGKLQLDPKAHFQTQEGRRYRVIYSPAMKFVWALEPAGDPNP